MEVIPAVLLEFIISYALQELSELLFKDACLTSKRKYKKLIKRITTKKDRHVEIQRKLSELSSKEHFDIMKCVTKISEEVKIMNETSI